jgi:hypothetical protein
MSEIAAALQKLASYRSHNTRASQEVFKQGLIILNSNAVQITKMGDDGTELSIPESNHLNILQDGLSWNNWLWQLWM